ncbi:MAG: nucleoside deaminase [Arenicellales bacterium WSBS_2016_MAG_OTU3]
MIRQKTLTAEFIKRLLDVIELDIVPLTRKSVAQGNKIFGAAILHKSDLSLVLAETNFETDNPLWHGEVHALKRFYELENRPDSKDCIFLSTHEPCTLCLSAITWTGFDNFYYLFSHEDSRDSFAIPHDLKILKEVFRLEPGGYASSNAFWDSYDLKKAVENLEGGERAFWVNRIKTLVDVYAGLSTQYQNGKHTNVIPLA